MAKIIDIIKYEGDNETFIYKHPCEDFNSSTQLIVHESQQAVLFKNGQALDLFGPGRHTLESENIPLLKKFINLPSNNQTPFHCEVYFINKTEQMAISWGTNSRVQYIEPTYNFPLAIGASGEMSLMVDDARKLLLKLVGTTNYLTQAQLVTTFRAFLMTKVKTYIAQTMKANQINIFEIDEHLEQFSNDLKVKLVDDFKTYGVLLTNFFVTTVVRPDGDPVYENFKDLYFRQYADVVEANLRQKIGIIDQETLARQTIIESQGLAQKRAIEGYTYQQERQFDVSSLMAQNEGAGNFSSAGIGLGMVAGIGGVVGQQVSGVFNEAMTPQPKVEAKKFCDNCGHLLDAGAKFCDECGQAVDIKETCVNCGYVFNKPGKFCPGCGMKRG